MKQLLASLLIYLFTSTQAPTPLPTSNHAPRRYITRCADDGQTFSLQDAPAVNRLSPLNDVRVHARRSSASEQGATFSFTRDGRKIGSINLDDLFNPNGWITPSPNWQRFAITWSDGGGGGDWHTRIFHFSPNGNLTENTKATAAVEKDFRPRHDCKERGDNFEAIRWMDNDHLLVEASVYNSSACDAEMGYSEGYLVAMSTDSIQKNYTEQQLIDLPEVCTWNSYPEDLPR